MGEPLRQSVGGVAAAALRVRYKYASTDEFIRKSSHDISLFGIFIRTKTPLKEGVPLLLELQLKDGSPVIRGLGLVAWRREIDQLDEGPSGMGIKFLRLDETSREVVERAVEARGAAPSRFNRLGQVTAGDVNESELPFPKHTRTLVGIPAAAQLNADKPSSPSLNPDAPPSTSELEDDDNDPSKYSYTRVKTVSMLHHDEEPSALSDQYPEGVEPVEPAKPATVSLATALEGSDETEPAKPATISLASALEGLDVAEPAAGSFASALAEAIVGESVEPVASSFVSALAEANVAVPPAEEPGVKTPELPLMDTNRAPLTPLATTSTPTAPQGDTKHIRTITAPFGRIATRDHTNQSHPASERAQGFTFRERLASNAAFVRPMSEQEAAQHSTRLAELSKAEVKEYAMPRPLLVLAKLLFSKR
jgi:uncharacterized protein (TIGR02266 family)